MEQVYWVTENDVYLADENGNRLVFSIGDDPPLPPPPEWLAEVLKVRFIIGDPICTSLIYADVLPESALEGQVYTSGDGVYYKRENGAWVTCRLTLDDRAIDAFRGGSTWQQASRAIDLLLIRINPLDYITSGNAGGQSVSFPSLADVLAFFNARKAAISSWAVQAGDVQRVGCHPVAVGGVYEECW
jgi:hypothetical protein